MWDKQFTVGMLAFDAPRAISDGGSMPGAHSAGGSVVYPVIGRATPRQTLDIAIDLAERFGGRLVLVGMETVPNQTPLDHPDLPLESGDRIETAVADARARGSSTLEVSGATRVGRHLDTMIIHESNQRPTQMLVIDGSIGESDPGSFPGDPIESVLDSVETDVVVATGADHLETLSSILVPIAGGPHSGLAVDVAKAVATENDAVLELFHVVEPDASDEERELGEQYIEAAIDRLGDFESFDTWLYEAPDIAEAIIEQTAYYDLTIIGAPQKGRLKRFIFGSKTDAVLEEAVSTVLTVRARDADRTWFETWLGRSA